MSNPLVGAAGTEKDTGPERVYGFLSRTGFLDTVGDKQQFNQWMNSLTPDDFQRHLVRLNGMVRQIKIKDRRVDGENVAISNELMGTSYLPPKPEDKDELMKGSFDAAKNLPQKDAGLLLYMSLQAIHPFVDGNGRTGRLLYLLLESGEHGKQLNKKEITDFLTHDGETGPGRDMFEKKVRPPQEAYHAVEFLLARDVLGEEIMSKCSRLFSGLQGGVIEDFTNDKVSKETKDRLMYVMSEGGGNAFSFRNIVLAKYLEKRGLVDTYAVLDAGKKLFRMDGHKILEEASEADANEIVVLAASLKKRFVEKLIDVIAHSENYKFPDGKTVKDGLFQQSQAV